MPVYRIACHAAAAFTLVVLSSAWVAAQQLVVNPALQPPRDRMPPPRTGTAVVKGRVVDGTTGAALARARVSVQGPMRTSVITDAGGGFAIANLPAGPLMLAVEKATYMPGRYPLAGRTIRSGSRPVTLSDGQVLDSLTIPLFHGAAIMGRVLDANGDPLDNAQVSALRVPAGGRIGRPVMRSSSSTDDRGEFRLGRLDAGSYILQVSARRNVMNEEMPGAAAAPPAPQPLPTFYPTALSIDGAQPIALERGQTVNDIDITLAEGFPGVVNGTVATANGGLPAGWSAFVNVRRVSSETSGGLDGFSSGTGVRPDGSFRLTLPPGEYQIEARATPRSVSGPSRQEDEQFVTAKVMVTSGQEDSLALIVGHGASAAGRVIFEGTAQPPPSPGKMRIPMFSENGMCRSGEATIGSDWSFHVDGLTGTCTAPPMAMFGRWVLKAVMVNGNDVTDSPMTFGPNQQLRNVQVIVTDRRSSLSFRVADENGQATREYVAIVYPVEKESWRSARIFVGPPPGMVQGGPPLQLTGSAPGPLAVAALRREEMVGLRPGEYFAVAVDDLEPEDYRDPAVLDRLRSSAMRVTVPEGSSVNVPLRRVSFADVMARR